MKGLSGPIILCLLMLPAQLLPAGHYGIFGDEMYFIACSKRLAFGFVDHPPLVDVLVFFTRLLFGDAIVALRFMTALTGSATVLLSALIARDMGGGRFAQGLAALMIFVAPALLGMFNIVSVNAFDVFFCTLCAWLFVRLLNGASGRTWLLLGLAAGLGLQNKYTMAALCFSLFIGVLATPRRRCLATPWPWLGGIVALLIFLPNLLWQGLHGWPFLSYLRYQASTTYPLSTPQFLGEMAVVLNPVSLPVWMAGLYFLLFGKDSSRYRSLGIGLVVFLALCLARQPRYYYLLPVFHALMAAGAVATEQLIRRAAIRGFGPAVVSTMVIGMAVTMPTALPILPIEQFIPYWRVLRFTKHVHTFKNERADIPEHFSLRFGWQELAEAVARIYHGLPDTERSRCAILARGLYAAAAVDFFGPQFGLPNAISTAANYRLWGPRHYTGECVIAVGHGKGELEKLFGAVEQVAAFNHPHTVARYRDYPIYICRMPVRPLAEIWDNMR